MEEVASCIKGIDKSIGGITLDGLVEKLSKYDDIKDEFIKWSKQQSYDFEKPVKSGDYTAKEIAKTAPNLNGIGVYTFMVTLRDKPEQAKQYIEEGFTEL